MVTGSEARADLRVDVIEAEARPGVRANVT